MLLPRWWRNRLAIQGVGLETRDDTVSILLIIAPGNSNLGSGLSVHCHYATY
jgi:hypothetical protein